MHDTRRGHWNHKCDIIYARYLVSSLSVSVALSVCVGGYKFHVDSYCEEGINSDYPDNVNSIGDVITIVKDVGNQIPDYSWMLYLLEFYIDPNLNQPIPAELNLICTILVLNPKENLSRS
jgi:hypothetical protein